MDNIKKSPIWLLWRYEERNGKRTKVPYQSNGVKASSTNSKTWTTYEDVIDSRVCNAVWDGVGIVFEPSQGVIGIDFDKCWDNEKNTLLFSDLLDPFLKQANTYCEFSPSHKGFHLLFSSPSRVDLESNKHYFEESTPNNPDPAHVEAYSFGRFFTFTGEEIPDYSKPLRTVEPQEFFDLLKLLGYPWKKTLIQTTTQKYKELTQPLNDATSPILTDAQLLAKMFSARNGQEIQMLYGGNMEKYHNDASSADFALCLHLAFWTRKDPVQIERLWLSSPLGQRAKTENRQDYRERTIRNAIEATQTVYDPIPSSHRNDNTYTTDKKVNTSKDEYEFFLSGGEHPTPILAFPNIIKILRINPYFQNKFRKNDFSHFVESCLSSSTGEWSVLTDDIISLSREFISQNFPPFRKLSKEMMTDAILRVAADQTVNPPRDYFTSLAWDGIPRLNSWLHNAYGVPDDELNQAIGSNWIKGLVKRVMKPGCQFDEVLALESPQGWFKSSSIRALGEPWHVETTHAIDNKDFYLILAQNIIVEFSEGEIFDRASVKKLKAEITKTEDQVRPPYERGILKFKRSCVFAVTTNQLELKDDTGNRRWLPVSLEKPADVKWIKENRDQLFAEAYHRAIILKESTHEYPKDSLEELQSSRAERSDYDEKTLIWYASLQENYREEEGISTHEAIKNVFHKLDSDRIQRNDELQMAGIFRRTLCLENKNKRLGTTVNKRWFPTNKTRKLIEPLIATETSLPPIDPSPGESFNLHD